MIKHSGKVIKINTGSYVGDASQNRAIPHSLGVMPRMVIVTKDDTAWLWLLVKDLPTKLQYVGINQVVVTAMTATNFYVGDNPSTAAGANANLANYSWCAIG